jgi:cytochrome P450
MATTKSKQQHQRLRELFSPMLTDASMSRMLPKIQSSVQRYMREWAARGTVPAYTETLTLMFDVLVRCWHHGSKDASASPGCDASSCTDL